MDRKSAFDLVNIFDALIEKWRQEDDELSAARAGLENCDRTNEANEDERINVKRSKHLRELLLESIVNDKLTSEKAIFVIDTHGYKPTGFCFRNPDTGNLCIVERCAVRWIDKDEAWKLMHPQ